MQLAALSQYYCTGGKKKNSNKKTGWINNILLLFFFKNQFWNSLNFNSFVENLRQFSLSVYATNHCELEMILKTSCDRSIIGNRIHLQLQDKLQLYVDFFTLHLDLKRWFYFFWSIYSHKITYDKLWVKFVWLLRSQIFV